MDRQEAAIPRHAVRVQRREQIGQAVIDIMATRGIEEVSLRDVAAEAGVSMGLVQHYFATKDQMLFFACQLLVERTRRRTSETIAASPAPRTARLALRTAMLDLLPLDDERRRETRVWLAFLARAGVRPELAELMRETWAVSHAYFTESARAAIESGELPAHLDPDAEAHGLLSLTDGLVGHVQVGHYSAEDAAATIDRHLDRLVGSRGQAR